MVSTQRRKELQAAFKKGAPGWPDIDFFDSINSVQEFDELMPLVRESGSCISDSIISFYRETLVRWPDPKLEDWFKKEFPLVFARLDTPQKIRTFFRGADFRDVSVSTMASVFEDVIRKHYVDGQKVVKYERYRDNSWCDALRIVYHTQIQAWSLNKLLLPGCTYCGCGTSGLFIDWRTKKEREAASERW